MYAEESKLKFKKYSLIAASLVAYVLDVDNIEKYLEEISIESKVKTIKKLINLIKTFDLSEENRTL